MMTVFVFVTASSPTMIAKLGQDIADVPGVYECYSVTGDHDIVAILRVTNHEDIASIVTDRLAQLPGVASTRTSIAFKTYSSADHSF